MVDMAKDLKYAVVVGTPDGDTLTIKPGDDIPSWAREQIGAHAFSGTPGDIKNGVFDGDDDEGTPEGPPPQSGRGSGKDAWAAYAATLDVEVAEDATREDIIAAIEAAGQPVE